ncbi:membrane-like protein [Sphingobium soli]|uniref:Membrane-like protein n=1 Tax=Sphingobium soli TaxID=1591116 RepID=A0ABS8H4R6_9SPHN|nr:membrane-like protein [Sphingobium soli]MCC4232113.1 membrane-like protein [Sphingobium soli]
MRLAALLLLALSAGCGDEPRAVVNAAGIEREAEVVRAPITTEPAKSDNEGDRSTSVAPPAKPLVSRGTSARDPSPPDYRAIGTEPFWAVTVRGATAVLERPDAPPLRYGVRQEMDSKSLRYLGDGFTMTISEGPCSDGMSDALWSDRVQIAFAQGVYKGCGGDREEDRGF